MIPIKKNEKRPQKGEIKEKKGTYKRHSATVELGRARATKMVAAPGFGRSHRASETRRGGKGKKHRERGRNT